MQSGRPDLLPKIPTHNDVTSNSGETALQLIVGKLGARYHGSSHQVCVYERVCLSPSCPVISSNFPLFHQYITSVSC
jgi:hypothetical protein